MTDHRPLSPAMAATLRQLAANEAAGRPTHRDCCHASTRTQLLARGLVEVGCSCRACGDFDCDAYLRLTDEGRAVAEGLGA